MVIKHPIPKGATHWCECLNKFYKQDARGWHYFEMNVGQEVWYISHCRDPMSRRYERKRPVEIPLETLMENYLTYAAL